MNKKVGEAMKLKQLLFSALSIPLLIGCSRQAEPELPLREGIAERVGPYAPINERDGGVGRYHCP
jgi:hypothetical protein